MTACVSSPCLAQHNTSTRQGLEAEPKNNAQSGVTVNGILRCIHSNGISFKKLQALSLAYRGPVKRNGCIEGALEALKQLLHGVLLVGIWQWNFYRECAVPLKALQTCKGHQMSQCANPARFIRTTGYNQLCLEVFDIMQPSQERRGFSASHHCVFLI